MKRKIIALGLALSLLLSGCSSLLLDGEYVYTQPHINGDELGDATGIHAGNYNELYNALCAMVEAGQEKADLAALENDPLLREQAARAGGVVVCGVSGVDQPKPNFSPCTITVDSAQGVIRLRRDDKIRIVGTNVAGVVRGFETAPNGGTRVTIEIKSGFKTRGVLTVGAQVEVIRDAFAFVNHRALKEVRENQSWIFYGDAAPTLPILPSTGQSALAVARAARR